MTAIELTDKELRLAKANVAYALENCPVEGGIISEAGHFSTRFGSDFHDKYEQIVEKLEKSFNTNGKGGV